MVILRLALCILRLIHRQGFLEIGPWAPNLRAQARVAHFSALGRRHADPSSQPAVTQPSEITGFRGTVGAWRGRLPMLKKGSRAEPPTMPEAWGRNMASAWGATDRPQQERRWRGQPTGLGVGQPSWPGQVPTEREAGPVLRPGRCLKPSSLLQPPPGAGPEAGPTLPRAGGALPGLSGLTPLCAPHPTPTLLAAQSHCRKALSVEIDGIERKRMGLLQSPFLLALIPQKLSCEPPWLPHRRAYTRISAGERRKGGLTDSER